MIKIVIKRDISSDKIIQIEVKGHSNKAEYGKDLVCAAVSAIMTGGMNALTGHDYQFILEEGHALINALDIPSQYDAVVLKTIETQLLTVEEAEKDFVQVKNL